MPKHESEPFLLESDLALAEDDSELALCDSSVSSPPDFENSPSDSRIDDITDVSRPAARLSNHSRLGVDPPDLDERIYAEVNDKLHSDFLEQLDGQGYTITRDSNGVVVVESSSGDLSRLTDVAAYFGLTRQYLNNLIKRYKLVDPPRDSKYGSRDVYSFRPEDIKRVADIVRLKNRGYSVGEIREVFNNQEQYKSAAVRFSAALSLWQERPDPLAWAHLVGSLVSVPGLSDSEQRVLILVELGASLEECAQELELSSEDEVRTLLDAARNNMSRQLFHMLRSMKNVDSSDR